eukprot:9345845-Prorocentrum_lima.AAC.1
MPWGPTGRHPARSGGLPEVPSAGALSLVSATLALPARSSSLGCGSASSAKGETAVEACIGRKL